MHSPNGIPPHQINGIAPHPAAEPIRIPRSTADHTIPPEVVAHTPARSDHDRREVRRSQPVIGEPGRSRSATPVMSDGISAEGFAKTLEQVYGKTYPLHLARLRFFDESAAEACRQLERTHDAAAQESARRRVRQEARLPILVAEIAALGEEEQFIQKALQENRAAVAQIAGRLGLHLPASPGRDIAARIAEARRVRSRIAKGEPTPEPGISNAIERAGNLALAALFALTLGVAIGINLHLFDVRILEDPADAPVALALCYAVAFAVESALGDLAERLGKEERGDKPTPTLVRCFASMAFYVCVAGFAVMEGLALEKISRYNASPGESQLSLSLLILIGGAINLAYLGLRIKKGAAKRAMADAESDMLGGRDFSGSAEDARALAASVNHITTGETRLGEIQARVNLLCNQYERTLAEPMSKQTCDILRQYNVEARGERARAEKEMSRITQALEKLPSRFPGGFPRERRGSRGGLSESGDLR
jgi:hypothetical protein